jgi:hypothetical protein
VLAYLWHGFCIGDCKEASMQPAIEGPNNYRVEVSGWDALAIRVIRQNGDSESASNSAWFRVVRVHPESEGILVQAHKMQPYFIWNTESPLLN